ncbi:alpha/beta hydrolase [Bifidobacterium phasiani]|uniref:Alpha/beta fold hydrolase n=1 Tax=Bifidobacterium phasiani TaxID=2834431 RepID=A0ABS6WAV8_9BIFI|nr:alpha/beta fold hydrolase [Bifidobacterium phasiani]MBW3083629.1 alpha/beta fold hydrolase [Bifidobacterium phasiani]
MNIALEPMSFDVDGGDRGALTLRGTRYLPEGFGADGGHPVAVLMHGFGGNRIDFSGFIVQVGRTLAEHGVVAVAYDRAGHGESDGDFFDTTIAGDVDDALQVIAAVRRMPGVDPNDLHLVGLSFGAVQSTYLAPLLDVPPRSLTLCSTASSYADEIRGGHLQGQPLDSVAATGYFDFMGVAMGPALIDEAKATDVYAKAQGYDGPVLFVHGTEDFIPVDYVERYRDVYGERMETMIVQGGNHGFGNVAHRRAIMPRIAQFVSGHALHAAA